MVALNWWIIDKIGLYVINGSEVLAFLSHCWANFQPVKVYSVQKFKLKHENSEYIIADCLTVVIFNLHRIKLQVFKTPATCTKRTMRIRINKEPVECPIRQKM